MNKKYTVKLILDDYDFRQVVEKYSDEIVSVATEQTKKEEDAK